MTAIVPFRRRAPKRPIVLRKLRRNPIRKKTGLYKRQGRLAIGRGLRQSIIPFKRTVCQVIDTDQTTNFPQNWSMTAGTLTGYHALLATQIFQLSQLPEYQNIVNMYKWYKINCVVVKIYPCYSSTHQTGNTATPLGTYFGQNMLITYTKNNTGNQLSTNIDNDWWMTQQARKQKILTGNKPVIFKVYPKLINEVYSSLTNTDYTLMKPKFISTEEPSTPFFGLDMAFSNVDFNDVIRVNDEPNYTTPLKFRMDMTYYMSLKGTH